MSWNDVDNKHKRQYDTNFVSCEEPYERQYLRQVIKEEFPNLSVSDIDAAIAACCASVRPPRPRQVFLECLKRRLGGS